jgi:hypothetical protein
LPLNISIPFYFESEPLVFLLMTFHLLNIFWQGHLLWNLIKGIRNNLTTNEYINQNRYPYLKNSSGEFYNPFDRGLINNVKDVIAPYIDYYQLYHLNIRENV